MPAQRLADGGALVLRRHPEARQQLALPAVPDALDRPAHREPLEEELDLALPRVLAGAGGELAVRAARRRRHRAAQLQAVVRRRRRPELLGLALARPLPHLVGPPATSHAEWRTPITVWRRPRSGQGLRPGTLPASWPAGAGAWPFCARRHGRAHYVVSAARSSCSRTSPRSGSAWPGHAAAGSSAASLRIDARACSWSRLKAGCGTRGAPLRPVCGSSV